MSDLREGLIVAGVFHALLSATLLIISLILRVMHPRATTVQPHWELPLIGFSDLVGLIIIFRATAIVNPALNLGGPSIELFSFLGGVYGVLTIPIVPLVAHKLFVASITRRSLAKALLPDLPSPGHRGSATAGAVRHGMRGPALSTSAVAMPAKEGYEGGDTKENGTLAVSGQHYPQPGPTTAASAAPAAPQRPVASYASTSADCSPKFVILLFFKCVALSLLSVVIWGISRVPWVDSVLGPNGCLVQRWIAWVTVTVSLIRTLVFVLAITIGFFDVLTPGILISAYVCLFLNLIAFSTESIHRLHTSHESDGEGFTISGSFFNALNLDRTDIEYLRGVMAAKGLEQQRNAKGLSYSVNNGGDAAHRDAAAKGSDGSGGWHLDPDPLTRAGFFSSLNRPQFRSLTDRLEYDIARRADSSVFEGKYTIEVAKLMSLASTLKVQSHIAAVTAATAPPPPAAVAAAAVRISEVAAPTTVAAATSPSQAATARAPSPSSTRFNKTASGPPTPPAQATGPPPFPMEIPDDDEYNTPPFKPHVLPALEATKPAAIVAAAPALPSPPVDVPLPANGSTSNLLPPNQAASPGSTATSTAGPAKEPDPIAFNRALFFGRDRELAQVLAAARSVAIAHRTPAPTGSTTPGGGTSTAPPMSHAKGFLIRGECGIGKTAFVEACRHDLGDLHPVVASYTAPNRACLRSFSALGSIAGTLFDVLGVMRELAPSLCPTNLVYGGPGSAAGGAGGGVSRTPTVSFMGGARGVGTRASSTAAIVSSAAAHLTSQTYLQGMPDTVKAQLPLLNLLFPNFAAVGSSSAGTSWRGGVPAGTSGHHRHASAASNSPTAAAHPAAVPQPPPPPQQYKSMSSGALASPFAAALGAACIPETDPSRMRIDQPGLFLALATVFLEVIKYFTRDSGFGLVVIVIENVQWCDEMSLQVLSRLTRAANTVKVPLLLLATMRDGYNVASKCNPMATDPDISTITLSGMKPNDVRTLADCYPVYRNLPDDLLSNILDGSRGNPLFVRRWVEIIRYYDHHHSAASPQAVSTPGSPGGTLTAGSPIAAAVLHADPAEAVDSPGTTPLSPASTLASPGLSRHSTAFEVGRRYSSHSHGGSIRGAAGGGANAQPHRTNSSGQRTVTIGRELTLEDAVRKALALSVEASDRFFLQQPVEVQEFMSLISVLGPFMDVEAMFYLYRNNATEARLESFIKILRLLVEKRILLVVQHDTVEIAHDIAGRRTKRPSQSGPFPHNNHPTAAPTTPGASPPPASARPATVSDVPRYDPVWFTWDHESTMEVSYKKLSIHTRIQVHSSAAKFFITKLSRKEERLSDVSSLLEIAYHLDRCGAREVALLYFVVAVELDSYGYHFLTREDILLYADTISFRQRPSGPCDPPRPPLVPEPGRDLLHGTLEYLLSAAHSGSDPVRHARYLWTYGSQCVGRVLPTLASGGASKLEAEWKIQAVAMKARLRHARGRRGMDDNVAGRRAGATLRDLTPLIGINADSSYHRALYYIIQAVGMLEAHGASNGELLIGYGWLQHHLAVGRHFGLRELIIKKGRDLIAAMSPEMMSRRRRSVAFFEGMIGMGSAAAGGYGQADAFLGSATVLADIMALSYPLTDIYAWHVMILFHMGRVREASRLARDARSKIQGSTTPSSSHASPPSSPSSPSAQPTCCNGSGGADPTSRDLADALHLLLCLNIGHGSHSRGLTLEARRLAEELIHRVLEDLSPRMVVTTTATFPPCSATGNPNPTVSAPVRGGAWNGSGTTGGATAGKLRHINTVGTASSRRAPSGSAMTVVGERGPGTASQWQSSNAAGVVTTYTGVPLSATTPPSIAASGQSVGSLPNPRASEFFNTTNNIPDATSPFATATASGWPSPAGAAAPATICCTCFVGTPMPPSKVILLAVTALIAIQLPNPTVAAKLLDYLLFPLPVTSEEENSFFLAHSPNPCNGAPQPPLSINHSGLDLAHRQGAGTTGAATAPPSTFATSNFPRPASPPAFATLPGTDDRSSGIVPPPQPASTSPPPPPLVGPGGSPAHHHPLKAGWVPGIPFAIACALEAAVRGLVTVPAADARRSSYSPAPYVPAHWTACSCGASGTAAASPATLPAEPQRQATNPSTPAAGNGASAQLLGLKAWRTRVELALEAASNAVKQKWCEPLAAEVALFRTCVKGWELSCEATLGASMGAAAGGGGGAASPRASTPVPPSGGAGAQPGAMHPEIRKGLLKAKESARMFQRTWVEAFVHAQADVFANPLAMGGAPGAGAGADADGAARGPPPVGFEDYRVFERECGGRITPIPINGVALSRHARRKSRIVTGM
ncbi:hypothetical protein HDU96_010015 [Phlyctochytrium bullatum]|nr:hypothetical protein HDU96_010015 [Phlyctochytrium bullatum]